MASCEKFLGLFVSWRCLSADGARNHVR